METMWHIEKLIKKGEYLYALVRNHPNRTKNNYVLHHRVVMENHLGRLLHSFEIVHHKDDNKHNNDLSNLEVLSRSAHASLHGKSKGRKYVTLKCPSCKCIFTRAFNRTHLQSKAKFTACSRKCRGIFAAKDFYGKHPDEVHISCLENVVKQYTLFSYASQT